MPRTLMILITLAGLPGQSQCAMAQQVDRVHTLVRDAQVAAESGRADGFRSRWSVDRVPVHQRNLARLLNATVDRVTYRVASAEPTYRALQADSTTAPEIAAHAESGLATLAGQSYRLDVAVSGYTRAAEQFARLRNATGQADAFAALAANTLRTEGVAAARAHLERAQSLAPATDRWLQARVACTDVAIAVLARPSTTKPGAAPAHWPMTAVRTRLHSACCRARRRSTRADSPIRRWSWLTRSPRCSVRPASGAGSRPRVSGATSSPRSAASARRALRWWTRSRWATAPVRCRRWGGPTSISRRSRSASMRGVTRRSMPTKPPPRSPRRATKWDCCTRVGHTPLACCCAVTLCAPSVRSPHSPPAPKRCRHSRWWKSLSHGRRSRDASSERGMQRCCSIQRSALQPNATCLAGASEPSTYALFGAGLAALTIMQRRRRVA